MGDTSKHLTYFKVENFKRFESFEMKDLGQFNLIVGDNNVGKTSVLEALLVDTDPSFYFNNLIKALNFRKIKPTNNYQDFELYVRRQSIRSSDKYSIKTEWAIGTSSHSLEILFDKNSQSFKVSKKVESQTAQLLGREYYFYDPFGINASYRFPFIPFYRGHDDDLAQFYSQLQSSKLLKKYFLTALSILLPDIEDIELSSPYPGISPHLIVFQKNIDASIPLALFGDGLLKLFRLLVEIVLNKGHRLMIDEIDTGIHFSHFKEFWKVILQTAKDNDVQLFMTTHNEECIKYFKEVLDEDLPDLQNDVRNITLVENTKTKIVTAHTYNFEQFEHAINVGNEIRS